MTPSFISAEHGGRVAPVLGCNMAQDRGGVAVLDESGVVRFVGDHMDALRYMDAAGLVEHDNAELVESRSYVVGLEAF